MNIKEETKPLKKTKPGIGSILLFVIITVLTLYAVFHGQDLDQIKGSIGKLSFPCLLISIFLALFLSAWKAS